jgi:dTDP-4-dehydrorhamnose reductase
MTVSERVLIAPGGMLGVAMARELEARGLEYEGWSRPELDITDVASVERAIGEDTALVVNCSAFTDVDGAEEREEEALAVNGAGVANLAARCARVGALLVHYSTDYVFNGRATAPYGVDEPREPVNAYGRSKAAGEEAIEASGAEYLLIRTSWLYAPWANNFVRTMARLGASRDQLRVVDDQRGRPTSAEHLARVTLALVEQGARGTFHVTDGGECTWYEFARAIVAAVNPACHVQPCTSAEFPRPAPRPAYSVLDLSKTEARLGPMPSWRDNLADVMGRIASDDPS